MTDATTEAAPPAGPPRLSLAARAVGVIFSPARTYPSVAAHPRWLGTLAIVLLLAIVPNFLYLSTESGQEALFQQQLETIQNFGVTVTDQMYDRMQTQLGIAPYTSAGSQLVILPLMAALVAGVMMGVFSLLLAGKARYRQVFAVVVHASLIMGLQQVFAAPINYARGEMRPASTLASLLPMLGEDSGLRVALSTIDFFVLWWAVSLAIGLSVLYARSLRSTLWTVLGLYAVVAVIITGVRLAF